MQELESLQNIFKDRIFKIPDYQRGYAWTTRQLKDFWEDVVNLPHDRFHYTGLLSLKKLDRQTWSSWNDEKWLIEDRGYKPFHIVDGQQRLTTFVIFIQAISELLKELPENSEKKEEDIYQKSSRSHNFIIGFFLNPTAEVFRKPFTHSTLKTQKNFSKKI